MEFFHDPVLLNECIDGLNINGDGIYVDGTLGGAGHAFHICEKLTGNGKLIGVDQDIDAIGKASDVLKSFGSRFVCVHRNFSEMKNILSDLNIECVNGVLLDLGVSSYQLDNPERGFSYMVDAPLDMRMDRSCSLTAYDVVNFYSESKLNGLIFDYGEERWAKRIASFIIMERVKQPINSTYELVSVIKKAIPKGARVDGPHPAKRTFQAIRIEVNGELSILRNAIMDMADVLAPSGRLCVISFHSLEDRIVKKCFKELGTGCVCPPMFPVCVCNKEPVGCVVTRKALLPSCDEISENPRSRSAKLRIFEKY